MHEYRVGLVPAGVRELVARGHEVVVETGAGAGVGIADTEFEAAGARIAPDPDTVFSEAELIVKVKEPQAVERARLRPHQALFTYLHLAADPAQMSDLLESRAIAIAYETVTSESGALPLLAPMSEVAGRMSIQAGARCLENECGGRGLLLGGVPGVLPANVVVLGGGIVGTNAAMMALGMGAAVTIVDRSNDVLRAKVNQFGTAVQTLFSTDDSLRDAVENADLVIGAVLIPGAAAPKLVTAEMIRNMKAGAVVVDVAVDQGGCFATSRPTTHDDPTYLVDDVVHYCVSNMPGAVARTSTLALTNATLPYVIELADNSVVSALRDNRHLREGLNIFDGHVTHASVAEAFHVDHVPAGELLEQATRH